jgi:hypothetical protein
MCKKTTRHFIGLKMVICLALFFRIVESAGATAFGTFLHAKHPVRPWHPLRQGGHGHDTRYVLSVWRRQIEGALGVFFLEVRGAATERSTLSMKPTPGPLRGKVEG